MDAQTQIHLSQRFAVKNYLRRTTPRNCRCPKLSHVGKVLTLSGAAVSDWDRGCKDGERVYTYIFRKCWPQILQSVAQHETRACERTRQQTLG